MFVRACTRLLRSSSAVINDVYLSQRISRLSSRGQTEMAQSQMNRLKFEKSPYLLQHASNPVDWWPWSDAAFAQARAQDKLIFLSVGYSTCHWCHVMERESFRDPAIASILNDHFIPIKVDREERPDVDKIYMAFIQASSGSGGWPMSVFLTPDLKPVAGGTYYPPNDQYGRPGFKTVLLNMAHQWVNQRPKVSATGNKIADLLKQTTTFEVELATALINGEVPDQTITNLCFMSLQQRFDPEFGGFAPLVKFPTPSILSFLFHLSMKGSSTEEGAEAKKMALKTLDKIAGGGIHDHVAQGFARYSTDRKWHVPHFEKMLYDQAQLAAAYTDAFLITKDPKYENIVQDILTYVSRDLSHKEGGFFSAEDADSYPEEGSSSKKEGAFYVWTMNEITKLLNVPLQSNASVKLFEVFSYHYGVKAEGNVPPDHDPHDELKGQNVLAVFGSAEETAQKFKLSLDELSVELEAGRQILFDARRKRPRPQLDDKIITSWNGLMISAFARAATVFNDEGYAHRAVSAANFVEKHLLKEGDKLLRSCYTDGNGVTQIEKPIDGFLDDYACFIMGLIDLYEATFNQNWLILAERLQKVQDQRFWDNGLAGYFSVSNDDSSLLFRMKEDMDGAEPSGNSVAAHNLIRLSTFLDCPDFKNKASALLSSFTSRLERAPVSLPKMVSALMLFHDSPTQVVVTGDVTNPQTAELIAIARSSPVPGLILIAASDPNGFIASRNESIAKISANKEKHWAYVCRGRACSLPVSTPDELALLLQQS